MPFTVAKTCRYQDTLLEVRYNVLTSRVVVQAGEFQVLKSHLWWPYQRRRFSVDGMPFLLTARLYPVCQFSLFADGQPVNTNLFPKMRSRSLLFFITGPIRHTVMWLSIVLS